MKSLRLIPALCLGLTACPGDDTGGSGTEGETDTNSTTMGPTSDPTTNTMSETTPSTSGPTTDDTTTTDPTTGPSEGSSSSSGGTLECPYDPVDGKPGISLELVADGFSQPVLAIGDPVETDVLYVLEKNGRIKRLEPGATTAPKDNWYEREVYAGGESGLLGLAFHPDYETDPRIYVALTPPGGGGDLYVYEYSVGDAGPDMGSERAVIGVSQQADNHEGGMIHFGADGMLYVSVGDGGTQNDGCGHGEDGSTWLGKILRIGVEPDGTMDTAPACTCNGGGCPPISGEFDYTIPADNPFVGDENVADEIYAMGFRNPWRFSIDPIDDSMWVGDVGQSNWEEVSRIEAGDNAGWGGMEGRSCFNDPGCDELAEAGTINADGRRMPVAQYPGSAGCDSVIGLGNYRSCEVPAWDGLYFYGDLCTRRIYAVASDGTTVTDVGEVASSPDDIFGGGYNAYGDVFVTTSSYFGGGASFGVYRIAPSG